MVDFKPRTKAEPRKRVRRPLARRWNREGVRRQPRHGLTLLELILALALSGLVMYAISFAVHLHLRALDARRTNIEEARLARSVLQMIANDIRGTIVEHEVDFSGVEKMIAGAAADAASDLLGDGGGTSGSGGDSGGAGGAGGGTPGGGAGGGGATGGGDAGGGTDTSVDEPTDETLDDGVPGSSNTADLASGTTLPPKPGLFGNQFQLQLDVSRVPRPDEYLAMMNEANMAVGLNATNTLRDLPSDIKTVTYYMQAAGAQGVRDDFAKANSTQLDVRAGLVRRSLDRQVTQFAAYNGSTTELFQTGEFLGPEVVEIQFQYFDGLTLLPEWDTIEMGGLPVAVQVTLAIRPAMPLPPGARPEAYDAMAIDPNGLLIYQMLVHLPMGQIIDQEELEEEAALEDVGL